MHKHVLERFLQGLNSLPGLFCSLLYYPKNCALCVQDQRSTAQLVDELHQVREASRTQLDQEGKKISSLADQVAKLTNDLALKDEALQEALQQVGPWPPVRTQKGCLCICLAPSCSSCSPPRNTHI
jgi:hypothetical protein